jgi:hypothetical protein
MTIISLVRNNTFAASSAWGFITSPERLNVMFSRTITRQVVVGCSQHIERNADCADNAFLTHLLEEYRRLGTFIAAEELNTIE